MKLFHTFIAQQASPVPLTVALPGDVASPVDTSRKKHTFITELALPAIATPVKHRCQNRTINHFLFANVLSCARNISKTTYSKYKTENKGSLIVLNMFIFWKRKL